MVHRVTGQQQVVHELEEGQIGADADGEVEVGQRRAAPEQAGGALGVLEAEEPRLRERVDRHDAGATPLGLLQGGEHPGVVGAGVLADDEQQLGLVDVLQRDGPLAHADRLGEGDAARLVAHVRAVGEVVRTEQPHEELVGEGGLVARAAGRVEDGPLGRGGAESLAHPVEGVVPRDRLVAVGTGRLPHRLDETALLAEPVVGLALEVGHGVGGEEGTVDPPGGGLLGHRLGAVLAELEPGGVGWLRPGAAGAVEAVGLVDLEERAGAPAQAHLPADVAHGPHDARQAGRAPLRWLDPEPFLVPWRGSGGRGHRQSVLHRAMLAGTRTRTKGSP